MLNPDIVGRTFTGVNTFTVTQESIIEFCAAIGEQDFTIAPPTYTIKISLAESQVFLKESGLNWDRVVHGDQKFEIYQPIVGGDLLLCSSTVESARVVAGNEIVTVRADLHRGSEHVASSWATLVARA